MGLELVGVCACVRPSILLDGPLLGTLNFRNISNIKGTQQKTICKNVRLSVLPCVHSQSNQNNIKASRMIEIKFHLEHQWMWESLHKVVCQIGSEL